MNYGYIRVSTKYQNVGRQKMAFKEANLSLDKVFIDKCSGKNFLRPNYQELIQHLKQGDCLYVKSIDRLGRNYEEIIKEWEYLTQDLKIDIVVLDCPLLNTTTNQSSLTGKFISNLFLQVLSYVAQIERENIKQRQREGINNAKLNGTKFGRPKRLVPKDFKVYYEEYQNGELSLRQGAKKLNVSHTTFSKWIKEFTKEKSKFN